MYVIQERNSLRQFENLNAMQPSTTGTGTTTSPKLTSVKNCCLNSANIVYAPAEARGCWGVEVLGFALACNVFHRYNRSSGYSARM